MGGAFFPGEQQLPEPAARRFAEYRPVSERPAPVRFAVGSGAFVEFLRTVGIDPEVVSRDLRALMHALRLHPELLNDETTLQSAGIFLGNTVATLKPDATWQVTSEPEIGVRGFRVPVYRAVRAVIERPDMHEQFVDALTTGRGD